MLIAAMNPCPCGYFGDPVKECTCSLSMVSRYQKRISGPLLDRIDIHIKVPRVEYDKLTDARLGEKSEDIRARVEKAREVQRQRFADTPLICNADMSPAAVREYCQVNEAGRSLLKTAMQQLSMSARTFHLSRPTGLAPRYGARIGSDRQGCSCIVDCPLQSRGPECA
jgi:magnesium chelatase family protein